MTLDGLLRIEVASFFLEVVRLGGVIVVAPLIWNATPARVKVALVLLIALAVHGQSGFESNLAFSIERMAFAIGSELMLGLAIGMVVRLVVASVEVAAEQIALAMGLGIAQVFDPQVQGSQNVLASLVRNLAMLVAVAMGLHRTVLSATIESFRVVPLGAAFNFVGYGPSFLALGGHMLATGLRIAVPVLAVLFMTQMGLAFIARAAPAMQIFSVGFAVTLGVGAFVLMLATPDFAYQTAAEMSQVEARIATLLVNVLEAEP